MTKMKMLADEMAAAGKPLGEDEFMSYVLTGLDEDYNPLVTAVLARVEPIGYSELLSQILSFEGRLEMQRGGGGGGSQSPLSTPRLVAVVDPTLEAVEDSAAAAPEGVVEASTMVASTMVVEAAAPTTLVVGRSRATRVRAKFASRRAIVLLLVGIVLMLTMLLMRETSTPP